MKKMYKNLTLLCCMTVFSLGGVFAQANDLCANAEALVLDAAAVTGDNTGGTSTADGFGSAGAPEVWYSFTSATAVNVSFQTFAGVMTDSQIALYDACGGLLVVGDDDGGLGNMSFIADFCAEAGVSYFLEVQGWNGTVGDFTVSAATGVAGTYCDDVAATNYTDPLTVDGCSSVDNLTCVFPPANDTCLTAAALGTAGVAVTGTTDGASATADDFGNDLSPDVFYSFVGTGNTVEIETFANGGMTDSRIAVTDLCGNASLDSDDDGGDGAMSLISGLCTTLGTVYIVEVQGFGTAGGSVGSFDISVTDNAPTFYCDDILATNYTDPLTVDACTSVDNLTCVFGVFGCADMTALNYNPLADSCDGVLGGTDLTCCTYPPANDDCANATPVICGDVVSGTNVDSSVGTEVLALECGTDIAGPGVWYSFASASSEEVTFSACGSALDTKINVYSGACGAFVCAGGNDDFCGLQSEVSVITAAAPTTYYVHVSGWNGNVGLFDLAITCAPASCVPPINDTCVSGLPVPDATPFIDDNVCAQANDLSPACAGFGDVDGVWYTWNSGANNALTMDFGPAATPDVGDSAAANVSIAMYSGNCANPTAINCFNGALVGEEVTGLAIASTYYFLVFTDDDVDQGQFDLLLTGGVSGCTTVGACNYAGTATVDDGSCDLSCLGCTDILALNYDGPSIADGGILTDDNSCVIPGCDPAVTSTGAICYDNGDATIYNIIENVPGEGVVIEFTGGFTENGFDEFFIFDAADGLGTQLNTVVYGDLTGQIFQSAGEMSFQITADGSVSCASGSFDEIAFTIYCGELAVPGCMDVNAVNYDPAANSGDQVALCNFMGCTNLLACNFDGLSTLDGGFLTDDNSCCLENCITVTITDTFGDGGTTVTLFDDLGGVLGSVVGNASENSATFCVADVCMDIVVSLDGFAAEAGVNVTGSTNGVLLDQATGSYTVDNATIITTVTVGGAVGCIVSGCTDAAALNYNAAANADCLDVFGGTDISCCIFPVENNDCDGALALTSGVELTWDSSLTDNSGNNCSPTLSNDMWYTYTPPCDMEVTITSFSLQGGQVAVWEGDCAALTLVECAPNDGLLATTTLSVILTEGVVYSIQTGSNLDFGPTSTGTILLEEGTCRGCTYADATNFDDVLFEDDGSCLFEECNCPGDFTGDGFVNVSDLGGFLGAFGTPCAP